MNDCHVVQQSQFHFCVLVSYYPYVQIANPYETNSDSFYFVDDKLIMHNKVSCAESYGELIWLPLNQTFYTCANYRRVIVTSWRIEHRPSGLTIT
jgi:hypothetical protein